jgi:hypothetical protein
MDIQIRPVDLTGPAKYALHLKPISLMLIISGKRNQIQKIIPGPDSNGILSVIKVKPGILSSGHYLANQLALIKDFLPV